MSAAHQLLTKLRHAGIVATATDHGTLRLKPTPPPNLIEQARRLKHELLALLTAPPAKTLSRRDVAVAAARQVVTDGKALAALLRAAGRFMQDYATIYGLERTDAEFLYLNHVADHLAEKHQTQIVLDYGSADGIGEPSIVGWTTRSLTPPAPAAAPDAPAGQQSRQRDDHLFPPGRMK